MLTGSHKTIVEPLLDAGINIVGLSEPDDHFGKTGFFQKKLEKIYWKFVKRQPLPYLSLLAAQKHISYCEKNAVRTKEYIQWLTSLEPDVLVLHQAPILPKDIFSLPRIGTINIHPSLLPKYRGSNPYFWMYFFKDYTAGITLHVVNTQVDTGDIIRQASFDFLPGTHYSILAHQLLYQHAIPMLIETLQSLARGEELTRTTQPKHSPTPHARRLSTEEYYGMLDFVEWPVEHLWHVLNSNDQWKDVFLPMIEHIDWYEWTLKGFEKVPLSNRLGEVDRDAGGYFVRHAKGKIYFKRRFKWTKFIKSLILYK